jgi:hypothetical protein
MNHRLGVMLALGALALGDGTALAQRGLRGDAPAGSYGWISSLEQGKSQARDRSKPLMVVIRCVP